MWWSKTEQSKIDPAQECKEADNQAVLDSFGESLAIIQFSNDGTVLDANQNFLTSMNLMISKVNIIGCFAVLIMPNPKNTANFGQY